MNAWLASILLCLLSVQMTKAQGDSFDPEALKAKIRQQIAEFKADFKNTKKFPQAEFTNAQLDWFQSIQPDSIPETEIGNSPIKMRKEYRTLSTEERNRLHTAFNAVKTTYIDGMSQYDIFVLMHAYMQAPGAHEGVAFLPWHREYLWRMELILQTHDSTVMLPYYDTQLDQTLPDPSASAIWTPAFLGNNDGDVKSGFAKSWITIPMCDSSSLFRNTTAGAEGQMYLFDDEKVNHVLNAADYRDLYKPYDETFEESHDSVHIYIGGHMGSVTCSPNDPVFWMHHAFVDCLWENYRQVTSIDRELDYPPLTSSDDSIGGAAHRANAIMAPFMTLQNIDGLRDHYTKFYYQCAKRPLQCTTDSQCGSPILYCSLPEKRCRAKVRQGGNCEGIPDKACDSTQCNDSLYEANCMNNSCTCELINVKDLTG